MTKKISTKEINEKWDDIRAVLNSSGYRVSADHPLDFWLSCNDKKQRQLLLYTTEKPQKLPVTKGLEIQKRLRKDGSWILEITCENELYSEVFAKLCEDIINRTWEVNDDIEGLNILAHQYLLWKEMFARVNAVLSDSVLKGIIGELQFACDYLSKIYEWEQIIAGWQGPDGADRDYVFNDNWFEVKALSTGKDAVSISSLDQLDTEIDGNLVVYNVDRSGATDPMALNFNDFIKEVKNCMRNNPVAISLMDNKLLELGYSYDETYNDIYYKWSKPTLYRVDDNFPKLTKKNIPHQIITAQYCISLSSIEPWKVKVQ